MTTADDDVPPAVAKAVADLADPDLAFMRPTPGAPGGVERVTVGQMTEEEKLLALTLLHHRRTRHMI